MKTLLLADSAHVVFGDTGSSPRLNDCPRDIRSGVYSCAECFLEASLDVFGPLVPSGCERRRYMEVVMLPALGDVCVWRSESPSDDEDQAEAPPSEDPAQ